MKDLFNTLVENREDMLQATADILEGRLPNTQDDEVKQMKDLTEKDEEIKVVKSDAPDKVTKIKEEAEEVTEEVITEEEEEEVPAPPSDEEIADEEEKSEVEEPEKRFFASKDDTFYYLIVVSPTEWEIVDQNGKSMYKLGDAVSVDDTLGFIIQAMQELGLSYISADIVHDYFIPAIVNEEEETEEEEEAPADDLPEEMPDSLEETPEEEVI